VSRLGTKGPHGGPVFAITEDGEAAESAGGEVGWWRLNEAQWQVDSGTENGGERCGRERGDLERLL
jgi:hypothetical protein